MRGMAIAEILALRPCLTDGGEGDGLDLYSPQVVLKYKMHFRRMWASNKGSDGVRGKEMMIVVSQRDCDGCGGMLTM